MAVCSTSAAAPAPSRPPCAALSSIATAAAASRAAAGGSAMLTTWSPGPMAAPPACPTPYFSAVGTIARCTRRDSRWSWHPTAKCASIDPTAGRSRGRRRCRRRQDSRSRPWARGSRATGWPWMPARRCPTGGVGRSTTPGRSIGCGGATTGTRKPPPGDGPEERPPGAAGGSGESEDFLLSAAAPRIPAYDVSFLSAHRQRRPKDETERPRSTSARAAARPIERPRSMRVVNAQAEGRAWTREADEDLIAAVGEVVDAAPQLPGRRELPAGAGAEELVAGHGVAVGDGDLGIEVTRHGLGVEAQAEAGSGLAIGGGAARPARGVEGGGGGPGEG